MKIQVIKVEVETTEKYKMAVVTYKNLTFNKTESRKIPSFKNPDVFNWLSKAVDGDTFEVETTKDGQYIQWTKVTKLYGDAATAPAAAPTAAGGTPYKSTYETPEERAKRQVYIVRQSSVSNAIAALSVGAKAKLDTEEILGLARQIEGYVFGNDPMQQLLDMPNDLPDVTV